MTRMFDIREPSLAALRVAPVYFRYGSNRNRVLVDLFTASAMLAVYDALKEPAAKAKFERMVAGDYAQFYKLFAFCMKRAKIGGSK